MPESSSHDVFISYATLDSDIANAVCEGLQGAGLKCWIAPRDVMPGEFYADALVHAIDSCKVMVLILSRRAAESPHVLREVERVSSKRHPIVSLRIDRAAMPGALEYFLNTSQWLDASTSGVPRALPKLVDSVRSLMANPDTISFLASPSSSFARRGSRLMVLIVLLGAVTVAYFVVARGWLAKTPPIATADLTARPTGAEPAFAPPPHSIAVLPFLNLSGDPKQEYFSDGLSEELLNSLTTVRDLQVAARTSSFSFKGKSDGIAAIARQLNVGAVLEGSVRKSTGHIRITAQLINAITGFHLWSHTYDRDLRDIFKVQTEIATAVTQALEATLMADTAETIELGGTQNPQAFDAYLRAKNIRRLHNDKSSALASIAEFDAAIRLDPAYAKAYAAKAINESDFAGNYALGAEIRDYYQRARVAAEKSLQLAPNLGDAHSALAFVLENGFLDFAGALEQHERALALSPNDSGVLLRAGTFLASIGRADEGARMAKRGASLDQVSTRAYRQLTYALSYAHKYRESVDAANRARGLSPSDADLAALAGLALIQLGDAESARQSCVTPPQNWQSNLCLAIAYDKLLRRPDAEAQLAIMKTDLGNSAAYQYAQIYAQWGDTAKSLDWFETAFRLKDPGMSDIKVDEFLNPLRKEPRFQEILRALNLPN